MLRFQTLTSTVLFAIHVLLVFLLVFQEKVSIPDWLHPVGRMHPMLLHLPIGLLVLAGLLWLFQKEFEDVGFAKLFSFLLTITALSAALSALMGFFLSHEGGYTPNLLNWHKYSGVALSFLTYGLVLLNEKQADKKLIFNLALATSALVLVVTGHFGASLTHGENYLFPSKNAELAMAFTEDTPVFVGAIEPILKAKCYQCHNEQKQKGGLLMTSLTGLLKGGKNGPIWVAGDPLNSHITQRANLPLDDKKHMPPKGKPQLAPDEVALLTAWIKSGADVKNTLKSLAQNDPLRPLAQAAFNRQAPQPAQAIELYAFDAASDETIQKLNTPFRVVFPLAHESPALQADFFVRQAYKPAHLSELSDVKKQLVVLNLSNMPVRDEDLKTIGQFDNLEKLILNNSDITGKTLSELTSLIKLKSLALSGTKVSREALSLLAQLPDLKEVFVWNTPILAKDLAQLQQQYKRIHFEVGYIPNDSEILKLNSPILVNEQFIVTDKTPITFRHPLKGVTVRYTTNGADPDTTQSPIYQKPLQVNDYTIVKARATKEKWYASDVVEYAFFKGTYHPVSADLANLPDPKYQGEGGKTLIDQKKGTVDNFKDGAWLGYREKPFEALFTFANSVPIKAVTLSIGKNVGRFIMPPAAVEIWGGPDKMHLKLLQKIQPEQPQKEQPARIEAVRADLKGDTYAVLKIIARPVAKLPAWHPKKGELGWVFIDEVFFN